MRGIKKYLLCVKEEGVVHGTINCVSLLIIRIVKKMYILFIKCFIPIKKGTVVFNSLPDFSDNARALVEYMVANGYNNRFKLFFAVEDVEYYQKKYHYLPIEFFHFSLYGDNVSLRSIKILYTAEYLLGTHGSPLSCQMGRKKQHYINLWHGCSFKDKTFDCVGPRSFDMAFVAGPLFVKTKAKFWGVEEHYIKPLGYPRYDWLIKADPSSRELLFSFKRNEDDKVILWMPTFRVDKRGVFNESSSITQFPLIEGDMVWHDLDSFLENFGVVLIIKLHPYQKEYDIPFNDLKYIKQLKDSDLKINDLPLYKFVAHTDALITDYSSIAVDYLVLNKPIAYTLDDFENYRKSRGFVIDNPLMYMPGHHLFTYENLKHFIIDINNGNDRYAKWRDEVCKIAISRSDNYCEEILQEIGIK